MAKVQKGTKKDEPRRLPRGRHALGPDRVLSDQRQRLVAAVPRVAAEHGYEAMSVADIVRAAAVSRNAFYNNFSSKQECFAAAHEACHERLLALLERPWEQVSSAEERVEAALGAALDMLSAEPDVASLLFVEAPAAGREIAVRYHECLRQYGTVLRGGVPQATFKAIPVAEVDQFVAGGIATRIAGELVERRTPQLRLLMPYFVAYLLTVYGLDTQS
jgi:AcrR family transcriptional regulator